MLDHQVLLELGRDLVPLVDPAGPQPLLAALRQLRTQLQGEGVEVGPIRVRDEEALEGRAFRLTCAQGGVEGQLVEGEECESLAEQIRPVFES